MHEYLVLEQTALQSMKRGRRKKLCKYHCLRQIEIQSVVLHNKKMQIRWNCLSCILIQKEVTSCYQLTIIFASLYKNHVDSNFMMTFFMNPKEI